MMSSSANKLLTKHEIAYHLRVTPQTIDRWVKGGKLKTIKIGRKALFDPNDYLKGTNADNQTPNT